MKEKKTVPLDKIISKLAGIGIPSLILIIAISATGYAGAAAISVALATLGPGGMVVGVITLLVTGTIASAITEYGVDKIFESVVKELISRGETKENILHKINKYPISKSQKDILNTKINTYFCDLQYQDKKEY